MTQRNVHIEVADAHGLVATYDGVMEVNLAPVINSVDISPLSAPPGVLRTITVDATDPEGGALTYTCTVDGQAASEVSPGVFEFTPAS